MIRSALALAACLLLTRAEAFAATFTIEMFRNNFLPESITIEVGDTVRWRRIAGSHTVTSGRPDGEVGTPHEPGALFDVTLDADNPEFEYTYTAFSEEGYFFFDRTDPDPVGFIQVSRGEDVIRVAVLDNVFAPEESYIFEGDSIMWEHEPMEDLHTVTSGRSSAKEDEPGALFDEESSDALPIFVYQFVTPGEYPYFCRPHEKLDMKGTVWVQRRFLRGNANGDLGVDISDAVAILIVLFAGAEPPACQDASDANDDGAVNISDASTILNFLFNGGPSMPPPFPFPGGDRTEDPLRCW